MQVAGYGKTSLILIGNEWKCKIVPFCQLCMFKSRNVFEVYMILRVMLLTAGRKLVQ